MEKVTGPKIFGSVTLGERGQIVVPADVRKAFGIKAGDRLIVFAREGGPIGLIPAQEFSRFIEQASQALHKLKKNDQA
jgi:AbrB family looped-hinge helix DNA binding protein